MRIIHTADWHFGKTLEGRSRIDEQRAFVDELTTICAEEDVDLVVMAGDVFQTVNPSAEAEELFYEALDKLSAGGRRGIVVISGNHDNPERIAAASPLADKLGISLIGLPNHVLHKQEPRSRTPYRVNGGPSWLELKIPTCDDTAVLSALPYPSEARLRELLTETLDEAAWVEAYNDRIAQLFNHLGRQFRADTINIAMSHLFVAGGMESDSEIQIQVGGTYAVHPQVFPANAQYVALGHLHRPQQIANALVPTRYSGSPLAYSFSEVGYTKSVILLDVVPGQPADIREIYLTSGKPLVKWVARQGFSEVVRWVDEGRDANAWVDLELHLHNPLSMDETHQLRSIHPGLVNIRPVFLGSLVEDVVPAHRKNLPADELFVKFFERQKGFTPDEGLVQLFMELIAGDVGEEPEELNVRAEEVAG